MSLLSDKVQSIASQVGAEYVKPEEAELVQYEEALFHEAHKHAMEYLLVERNLTEETVKHFRLGYHPDKDAIVIPVFKRGTLVNLRYRHLRKDAPQKYSQTKDAEIWIFNDEGLAHAQKKGTVLITEGEFDLMSCWQAGSTNVISPASGKDSYGVWIEMLDNIPKVYIAYDNDKGGKETAQKMADRLGVDKCFEVVYPHDIKDANEYYKKYTKEDYKLLVEAARPFYSHQFKGLGDIIEDLRKGDEKYIELDCLPDVKMKDDWLVMVSGKSNVGKTSYAMNMAAEITAKGIPVLVLPFERGPQVVGTRYLQVKYDHSEGEFGALTDEEWEKITKDAISTPLYFSMPKRDETFDLIRKAKRIFDTRVVIIDHLDLMVRQSGRSEERDLADTVQKLKEVAIECKVLMIVVHHVRKVQSPGSQKSKKPGMEDLKGSSAAYQDPECVVMLTSDTPAILKVDVVKNKGKMSSRQYSFSLDTGKIYPGAPLSEVDKEWDSWGTPNTDDD